MSIDKNHSEQFEKYLKRKMSSEEAHEFERSTLNDPFAQEALEGLEGQNAKQAFADINQLQNQVAGKSKGGVNWIRIAAVVALLIASSFALWFTVNQTESASELAIQEAGSPVNEIDSVESQLIDVEESEFIAEAEVLEESAIKTFKKDGVKVVDKLELDDEEREDVKQAEVEPIMTLAEAEISTEEITEEEIVTTEILVQETKNIQLTESTSLVIDKNEIKVENMDSNTLTQSLATNQLEEGDLDKTFPALAKRKMSSQARSVSATSEEMSSSDLEEVVLTAEALDNDQVALGFASQKNEDMIKAKPIINERKFKKYLEENLQYPNDAKTNNIEGSVELELTISSKGIIENIDIKQSIGYGCDEEAIRLIQEGPEWEAAEKDGIKVEEKVTVEIIFNL